ncbi:SH3 domain-containing protein [Neobacillus vireti]|uniref:SH3 domain-containing protein n=1 Tax=Neobacillus vireti TaxID=220686 RepID=UPI002FFF2790
MIKKEIHPTGELTLSRKETYGKNKAAKTAPVFTSRMEKREFYKNFNFFDIRNVLDVKGLLNDISANLHTYAKQVHQLIQKNPIKKLIVTGIFTIVLGFFTSTANAAFIQEYSYQVKAGERIETIAARHGITAQEILEANGLSSIDGKKILLPKVEDRTVTATSLNVRSQPTTNSSIIGKYQKGEAVKVSFIENGWAGILIKGRVCFVSAGYLTQTKVDALTNDTQAKTMYVTASALRVRETASIGSSVLGSLNLNDPVSVTSHDNGWAKINFKGKVAFVSETYLKSKETSSSTVYMIKKGDTFTKIAKDLGITVTAIQKLNPSVNPTKLKVGQPIKIPATTALIPTQIKVTGQIGEIDSEGTFLFITSDGHSNTAKATGDMINKLFNHQGEFVTLTLEGKRGQKLTLISLQ